MIELKEHLAVAAIRWLPASQGGRSSGPPTAPVYAATATFCSDSAEPDADLLSVLVQRSGTLPDGTDLARIGFLVPDLARPHMHLGAELLIAEGPKVVAHAIIHELPR
ncbi:hypothetical protein [Streptomyces sp. NPDC048669]|uniref:hypothetical protein n=1 Tax=Streptomyces sp. NPDC048669 TaxID=3155267 RepID=UPI003420F8E5